MLENSQTLEEYFQTIDWTIRILEKKRKITHTHTHTPNHTRRTGPDNGAPVIHMHIHQINITVYKQNLGGEVQFMFSGVSVGGWWFTPEI